MVEEAARYTLDLSVAPVLRAHAHLPVFVDLSHAVGERRWVPAAVGRLFREADGSALSGAPLRA